MSENFSERYEKRNTILITFANSKQNIKRMTQNAEAQKRNDKVGCAMLIILLFLGLIISPGFILLSLLSNFIDSCVLSWIITVLTSIAIFVGLLAIAKKFFESYYIISVIAYFLICLFSSIHIISAFDDDNIKKSASLLFPFIEKAKDTQDMNNSTVIQHDNKREVKEITLPVDDVVPLNNDSIISENTLEVYYIIEDNDGYVNLRSEPNSNSHIIQEILSGEKVLFISKELKWFKVKYDNKTGYIHGSRLKLSK